MSVKLLMKITLPNETFSKFVKDGTVAEKTEMVLNQIKPKSVYFTEMNGQRTTIAIVEIEDSSMIPALAEPWFLTFNAQVEFHPVMEYDDLKKSGIEKIGK